MEPFFNLRFCVPAALVYELSLFSLPLSLLFNTVGVRIWVLSSSALNVSQRICIVISSAQNLREKESERASERTLFSQDDDNFSLVPHTRMHATVYFSASIRPGLVSYPVSRAMRSSLIAAGRLFPLTRASPLRARSWLGDILFRVKRLHTHSQKRIH